MAMADYAKCGRCGGKAFYDANISDPAYCATWDPSEETPAIGLAVLCATCATTHEAVIRPRGHCARANGERVARAIAASDGHDWDTCSPSQREEYIDNAAAAIAALEPETVREDALREAAAAVCPKAIKNYGIMKPGKPDKYASREAQIVIKGFARLIQEDILALIEKDKTNG